MRLVPRLAVALGLFAALASLARPQDPFGGLQPHYWPQRTFGIPVNVDEIAKLATKPTHLQLCYSVGRGAFQKGQKLPLNGMTELNGGKRGFLFEAPRDGDYEFAVQFVYSDGSVSPKSDALAPEIRAIIDTVPPRVQLAPLGNGVEWSATDDNLDPQYTWLECKWPTDAKWTRITDRSFRPRDSYAWKIGPGKVLEVRVIAKDRAGNEGVSPVVRIPAEPGATVGLPRGTGSASTGGAALPQPRIDYVNSLEFNVDYTVQRMGRSGVQAAHLFVLKDRGTWESVNRYPVKLMPDDKGPHTFSLPYKASKEGIYGFYIIPESGAGKKADDPKKDDQPMVNVVVDVTPPVVKITGVQVKPGGTRGPHVEITWDAEDPNLMPQPVSLEWSLDKSAAKWNEVKYRLDNTPNTNTGRYTWEVPDDKLWKFWLRARAVDKAGNVGESLWSKEVIVDLEQPSATIDRVRGGSGPKAPEKQSDPEKSDDPPR